MIVDRIGDNGCRSCCGAEPMLRVRERLVYNTLVTHTQYECRWCGEVGGLGMFEPEARQLWQMRQPVQVALPGRAEVEGGVYLFGEMAHLRAVHSPVQLANRRVMPYARTMTREPVTSSNLASVGYDPATETLEVEFKVPANQPQMDGSDLKRVGAIWSYHPVTAQMRSEMLSAVPSIGSYFARMIKGNTGIKATRVQ